MAYQYDHARRIAISAFTAESTFDTAETVNSTNFYEITEFEGGKLVHDHTRRDDVGTGNEFGSEGYVSRKRYRISLTLPYVRPTDLSWIAAYGLGTTAATQDGALAAYRHKNTLSATTLPAFSVLHSEAGIQQIVTGCKVDSFTLSRNGDYWQCQVDIIGTRVASNADSWPNEVSEEPLLYGNTSLWKEEGADINIDAAPTQAAENISAATVDDIKADVSELSLTVNNALREDSWNASNANDVLCGGQLNRGAKREITVDLTQTFEDDAYMTSFLGTNNVQTHIAVEVDCCETGQGVIASTGAMYYGFDVILPRMVLDAIGESGDDDGVLTRSIKLIAKTPTTAADNSANVIEFYTYCVASGFAG